MCSMTYPRRHGPFSFGSWRRLSYPCCLRTSPSWNASNWRCQLCLFLLNVHNVVKVGDLSCFPRPLKFSRIGLLFHLKSTSSRLKRWQSVQQDHLESQWGKFFPDSVFCAALRVDMYFWKVKTVEFYHSQPKRNIVEAKEKRVLQQH